jgi:plastocyanin
MFKLITCALVASTLLGETITGTILIKRKLTRRSVTAPVSVYQRGNTVQLESDRQTDPLDFERSHVVIWLENEKPAHASEASIEQMGRRFVPDLVVIPAGSSVAFPNIDPIFHNVFSLSPAKSFDLGNYPRGDSRSVQFTKTGIIHVGCHLHPNMSATIVVTPGGHFARSDAAGNFEIPDLAAGRYSVVAWHKTAGLFRQSVQVLPGSGAQISFFIPLAEGPE